jgi:hypothetical protein
MTLHSEAVMRNCNRLVKLRSLFDRVCYLQQMEDEIFTRICILLDNPPDMEEWSDLDEMKDCSETRQKWIKTALRKITRFIEQEENWQKSLQSHPTAMAYDDLPMM